MDTDVRLVLERYPADCRPQNVAPLRALGGFSGAAIWKLQTPCGTLALRRWPREHPSAESLGWIHAAAAHALANGFRLLAQPIPTLDESTFLYHAGRLWELTAWLPGEAIRDLPPNRTRLENAMRALAEFHRSVQFFPGVEPRRGPSPGAIVRGTRAAQLLAGGIAELSTALDSQQISPELHDLGRRYVALFPRAAAVVAPVLDEALRIEIPLQPALRDVWSAHVLFVGDDVSGIIDLGAMRVESVASDIARLLGSFVADDEQAWNVGLAAYATVRPLDAQERRLSSAIDRGNVLLAPALWLRWLFVEGRKFDDMRAVVERLRAAVERARRLVESASDSCWLPAPER